MFPTPLQPLGTSSVCPSSRSPRGSLLHLFVLLVSDAAVSRDCHIYDEYPLLLVVSHCVLSIMRQLFVTAEPEEPKHLLVLLFVCDTLTSSQRGIFLLYEHKPLVFLLEDGSHTGWVASLSVFYAHFGASGT